MRGIGDVAFVEDEPLNDEMWAADPLGLTPYFSPLLWPAGLMMLIGYGICPIHGIARLISKATHLLWCLDLQFNSRRLKGMFALGRKLIDMADEATSFACMFLEELQDSFYDLAFSLGAPDDDA